MLNRQTRRLLKKQNKEIEEFIKWLKIFYSSSEKDKQAILLTLAGKNEALFKFVNDTQYMHYSAFAAGALIVGLPITVLYVIFQRYLIEGIMAGATKG